MSEIFAAQEGTLYLWTGSHTASGDPIGYVASIQVSLNHAWQSDAAVDGTYRAHLTNERADFSFQVGWLYGEKLSTLHAARTAVHAKLMANIPGIGSAGVHLYSGVLNTLGFNGSQGGVHNQPVAGFCHSWSAF